MIDACRVSVTVVCTESAYNGGEESAVGVCPVPSMSGISVRWIRNTYIADLSAYPMTPPLIRMPSGILASRRFVRSTATLATNLSWGLGGWGLAWETLTEARALLGVPATELIILRARTVKMGKNMVGQTEVDE